MVQLTAALLWANGMITMKTALAKKMKTVITSSMLLNQLTSQKSVTSVTMLQKTVQVATTMCSSTAINLLKRQVLI